MAGFTSAERELLKRISDDRWRTSLAEIREATEDIWLPDERIVRDYTDHGITHCQRLAKYAARLLEANTGHGLSAQEMYLLLAGIYLHDIGMQCDVVRFPDIAARVRALGGDEMRVTARTVSEYSLDEQKAIRKNHHLLTAAWIEHAYKTGGTVLGPAIRTVPGDLVADLIDVCKYHAKLPITECSQTFEFDESERKQLVAALLRFCDELDIDGSRVSIETVKNFSIDPRNAVYWWLHNRTKVVISRNVVTLIIRLHPDDTKRYGHLVREAFIAEFHRKNRPVLDVLRQNDIPVAISAESDVKDDRFAEPLPDEVVGALLTAHRPAEYQYQVAISYARPDRDVAHRLAELLQSMKIRVWYDEYARVDLVGKDLHLELDDVYQNRALYCVALLSKAYTKSEWTKRELDSIQKRMAAQESEYLIPVMIEDCELPDILVSLKHLDYRSMTLESIAEDIFDKLLKNFRDSEWRGYLKKEEEKELFLTPEPPRDTDEHIRLWEHASAKRYEQRAICDRECTWVAPWSGVKVGKVKLEYQDYQEGDSRRYDNAMPELARKALNEWREENPIPYAEKAKDSWGALVRFEGYLQNHTGYLIRLSPTKYLYYIAIQARLWSPRLSELRNQAFSQALNLDENKRPSPLMLPSNFAIHMGIVSKDNKVLLRQRTPATELYPEAWEAGIGEFMHGPRSILEDFPYFTDEGIPDLALFLKNAVKEEIDYDGASEGDFYLFGFAVEYRTLAPKLLAVYRSDAGIERLMEGALSARDGSQNVSCVELTPHGIAHVCVDPTYPTWGPTSKLVMMLALTQTVSPLERFSLVEKVPDLIDYYSHLLL